MPFETMLPATASSLHGLDEIEHVFTRIEAVRAAIGDDVQLMVDCHWRLDEASAMPFIERAARSRLHWLECRRGKRSVPQWLHPLHQQASLRCRDA
jgi:galactonate dehydratase